MYWLSFLFSVVVCCCIAYQDLKYRAVWWIFFPCLILSGLMLSFSGTASFAGIVKKTGVNLLFIFIQFILLQTWFFFSRKERTALSEKIGAGDLFFLLAACCYFSFLNFILFYLLSLIFSLAAYFFFFRRGDRSGSSLPVPDRTIPLAGLQSLFLVLFIGVSKALSHNIWNDEYFLSKLTL